MTGTEIIRMVLCVAGYDRNVSVRAYKGEGLSQGYEVHAKNKNGDSFYAEHCEGLPFVIWEIMSHYKEYGNCSGSGWWNMPSNVFKSDESVKSIREAWDEQLKKQKEREQ